MKQFLRVVLVALLSTSPLLNASAQLSQGGTPKSRSLKGLIPEPAQVSLGDVDTDRLLAEDKARRAMGKEFDRRFGYTFDVSFHPGNSGIWTELPGGDRIWMLKIHNPGALSLNLTFSKFHLPEGASLFLWGEKNQIGALTSFNNQSDRKLGTGLIAGDYVILEYFEPKAVRGKGELEIGKATHGYKNPFSIQGWGDSDVCEMNVNCPMGAPWQSEKRAVGRIIDNGDVCTGSLINNVMQDGKPYFLTANHCYSASSTTWVFSFNWESPTCTTPTTPIPENQTISGSTLKARNAFSDFLLLELNSKPPASFNPYFVGWNRLDNPSVSSTFIHHPAGDIKKISFDSQAATHSGYNGAANDSSHWKIGNYEFATTTEGGSSGCAMFDQDHRLVGQLHGGPASCTNISSDYYGKLSKSWNGGGTPATGLRDWLDPTGTGVAFLDGFDPSCRKVDVRLPWKKNIDTVSLALPYLWRIKNPNADSTFRLVAGGVGGGKIFRISSEGNNPTNRRDTLLLSPVGVSNYKKLRFRFSHAYRRQSNSTSDLVTIMASNNCGASFKTLRVIGGDSIVTDPATGQTSPFSPTDASFWRSHEIVLDSTFNRSTQLVIAIGFTSGSIGTLLLDEFELIGDTAKNKPSARFEANRTTGCAGVQVQFADSSLYNPTSWFWSFPGGTPATSTAAFPVVTYSTEGVYPVTLVVGNEEGADTLVKSGLISVQNLALASTPFLQAYSNTADFPPSGYILRNPDNNVSWVANANVNAPGSAGGSMMFDNYASPDVSGQHDLILFPKISTAGKNHLKLRIRYAYKAYSFGGQVGEDTLTIGFTQGCEGAFRKFWQKGGLDLATAGTTTSNYTPAAGDWKTIGFDLDSLLIYPEVSIGFDNRFGYGNRLFIDDIVIDTVDNCPGAPVVNGANASFCVGDTMTLSMATLTGATYSWTGPNNYSSANQSITRVLTANMAGTYSATVTVDGCSSPATSLTVTVNARPGIPVVNQNGNTLTGPAGQAQYVWILNGDTLAGQSGQSLTFTESGTYILVVYNANGCFRASAPKIVTGNEEIIRKGNLLLYPNPANGEISLLSESGQVSEAQVFDALGRKVKAEIFHKGSQALRFIFASDLLPGTYFVRVQIENQLITIPFLKK